MHSSRRGFTLIELVVALLIGSILTGIALTSVGSARGGAAVRGARTTFATLHARARAQAIEAGTRVIMVIDPAGDSVALLRGTEILETIRFNDELKVAITTSTGSVLRVCMNARGYADTGCSNFNSTVGVRFIQNADTANVRILPLGQFIY